MKTEDLKAKGLTEEQITFVMAENGKDVGNEKAKTAEETKKLENANTTINELQDKVKKFDGVDVEKLKKETADLQSKYDTDVSKLKLDNALELALITNKAKNAKAVRALLDESLIKLDGDKVLGLDEQLTKLKKEQDFLFDVDTTDNGQKSDTGVQVNSGGSHGSNTQPDYDKMTDDEYYKAMEEKNKK